MGEGEASTRAWTRVDAQHAEEYRRRGWWSDETLADRVDALADLTPDAPAFITAAARFTWREYAHASDRIAAALTGLDLTSGARVMVYAPDGPEVHAAFVGVEKAGHVCVGVGARAGDQEIAYISERTGARVLIALAKYRDRTAEELVAAMAGRGAQIDHLIVVPTFPDETIRIDGVALDAAVRPDRGRRVGPDDIFLINSTSGTTGVPKCVMHAQNRWRCFHAFATEAGGLTGDDVFFGAVPAPFGFGLWTAHFSPAYLGCPTVVMDRFNADEALDLIEREKVTVLCCVSTQFIMMLDAQASRPRNLKSLKVMFTGGEAVPYKRAAAFEETTGATVLQFYGSNETGALSCTTLEDVRERRLLTAGRIIDAMQVRVFDPDTHDEITGPLRIGQPGCRGPATCLGYWDDDAANAELFTEDGWMLMGDIVEIDVDGYLRVIGRTSDIIIRGGKNISAAAVESEVVTHERVALAAAVAAPDLVFGERVCLYVQPRAGAELTLEEITEHLATRGVSRDWLPEHLVLMDELPLSSGGKVAKGELRVDARRRWGAAT